MRLEFGRYHVKTLAVLGSDESRWLTGALIPIDGGHMSLREWPM